MIWNIDPIALNLGFIKIRYYGIFFFIGVVISFLGFIFLQKRFKKLELNLDNLFFGIVICAAIGGRLFHFLFSETKQFLNNPMIFFNFSLAGNAGIGSILVTGVFLYFHARKNKLKLIILLDHLVIFASATASMIRLGNFANSEIIGIPTSVSWGVVFSQVDVIKRHPVQLYEFIVLFTLTFIMLYLATKRNWLDKMGQLTGFWLLSYFGSRFFIETYKESWGAQLEENLRTGQWLSIIAAALGLILLAKSLKTNKSMRLSV